MDRAHRESGYDGGIEQLATDLSELFLAGLGRLTCEERSVYLLCRCFGLRHAEAAPLLHSTAEECSRMERRARRRLADPSSPV